MEAIANDEIAITGLSGRFAQADDLTEFKEKLYAGVDFVTYSDARWPRGYLGLPERFGTIRDLSLFDAAFFGVHPRLAHLMEPQIRLLLETSYEAIVDAGFDPETLRGRAIGVFVGSGIGDYDDAFGSDQNNIDGFTLLGNYKSMCSNRVSYAFDFRGPSFTLDAACSSTMTAFNQAIHAIRSGECEAAIVAASMISLTPAVSLGFMPLGVLAPDGKCKAFDSRCDGFVRSETVGAFFVQKVPEASRIYARLILSKATADGYKIQGITYPSSKVQADLLRAIYSEAKVDPHEVEYVEAHGTGTVAGDDQEMEAITKIFCPPGRQHPLKVGAVKTNVGHNETACGVSAIAKVILAMETGTIAANLHFEEPNPNIPSLHDGSVEIVAKPTPFNGGVVGVSSFGFGGSSAHAILQSNPGPHVDTFPRESPGLPRLVLLSGRSAQSLSRTLDRMEAEGPYPDSAYALLNRVGQRSLKQFPYRGFAVVPVDGSGKEVIKTVEHIPLVKRPLWFVFSGMGCQWKGMTREMMLFDVFAQSMHKSAEVLKQFDMDLIEAVTSDSVEKSHASTLASIAAVQVALVDTLRAVGVQPDGIVGHSVGEIACGYADGCLTAEETVQCAYWRGRCVDISDVLPGSMAAVGLTWGDAAQRCPDGVMPACDNAEDSVTVSGPVEAVAQLVDELKAEGVFAKAVDSMNVAYHSKYIHSIGPPLQLALEKVVLVPNRRSERWVSSSVPPNRWHEPVAQLCSAEYYVNNLVSPVRFREALEHVPKDAILVEIAPHCLLQPILRRALGSDATCLGLMKRDTDHLTFFLSTLGKLHTLGVHMDLSTLFPPVPFPVPRGTPSIGHLVSWDHSQRWRVAKWNDSAGSRQSAEDIVTVNLEANEGDAYLTGHCIDGRILFPVAGYMVMAWKYLAKRCGKQFHQLPVIFEDVSIHRATILPNSGPVRLLINVLQASGEFEICEGGNVVVSGHIRAADEGEQVLEKEPLGPVPADSQNELLADDFYKELRLRGYEYEGKFQAVLKMDFQSCCGTIKWEDNWVTFLDCVMQCSLLSYPKHVLSLPVRIQSCRIDPNLHARIAEECGNAGVPAVYERSLQICRAGGIAVRGVTTSTAPRRFAHPMLPLDEYKFVPYIDDSSAEDEREASLREYIDMCSAITDRIIAIRGQKSSPNIGILKEACKGEEGEVTRCPKSPAEDQIILQALADIERNARSPDSELAFAVQSALARYGNDLDKDLLNTALFREDTLRHLLDIAVENTSSRRMRILEFATGRSDLLLTPLVSSLLPLSNTTVKCQYAIAHPNPESLTEKQVPEGARKVLWDPTSPSETNLPEVDLIVVRDLPSELNNLDVLAELSSIHCREGGFVLLHHRTALSPAEILFSELGSASLSHHPRKTVESVFKAFGFNLVGLKSNKLSALTLLKKTPVAAAPEQHDVVKVKHFTFDWVDTLKNNVLKSETDPTGKKLWLVADDSGVSGIVGLVNCLRVERGADRIRCLIDISQEPSSNLINFVIEDEKLKKILESDLFMNIYQNGQWGSYRHLTTQNHGAPKRTTEYAFLNTETPGDLSSLQWYESPLRCAPSSGAAREALCTVYYAALNFRDVMIATGKLRSHSLPSHVASRDCMLGVEFSGRDRRGRRVMGIVPSEGIASAVAADPDFLWEVPEAWSLEQASTVPIAYSTAYYALLIRGNMQPGESLLVHAGTGGVGQAAISIALSMGCTVFTTVGTKEKREFLKRRFPELQERNIANSRDVFFEDRVLRETKGRGVDLVLNSLSEEKLQASVRCLATHGRFLEMGKFDMAEDSALGMSVFLRNVNFCGIMVDSLHEAEKRLVKDLVERGIASGVVRPLDISRFRRDHAEDAFRFMASGKHIGKVVLEIRQEESNRKTAKAPPCALEAVTRTYFYPHKCYVIIGGLGGMGLELADWMVVRQCRKLLLSSRSGVQSGYQRLCLWRWENAGVEVLVTTADASTKQGAEQIIEEALTMGPVGGIFNLGMVLRDALFENQTAETFEAACRVKVDGTANLDELSRKFCPELDHFVAFSSVVAGHGNVGQTNYGYANSAMERICERRVANGLPGLAIQWGVIGGVGAVQRATNTDVILGSYAPQRIASCLRVLDQFLNQRQPVVSSFVNSEAYSKPDESEEKTPNLVETITHIFGVKDSGSLDPNITLGDLSMDSLIGVEVQQMLDRNYGITLSMTEIRKLTLSRLRQIGETACLEASTLENGAVRNREEASS